MGYHARSAATMSVYRKALNLSASARQRSTVGEIVNLMQLDSSRLEFLAFQLHVMWDGLYQIAGSLAILVYYIGWPALAGVATMVRARGLHRRRARTDWRGGAGADPVHAVADDRHAQAHGAAAHACAHDGPAREADQ